MWSGRRGRYLPDVAAAFQPAVLSQPCGARPLEGGLGEGYVRRFIHPASHDIHSL